MTTDLRRAIARLSNEDLKVAEGVDILKFEFATRLQLDPKFLLKITLKCLSFSRGFVCCKQHHLKFNLMTVTYRSYG